MGCYGDRYAGTPNVDRLAAKGMIYLHAWSNAPVCAPARSTIISGIYPPSTGAEHMRSLVPFPAGKKMFPQLLREVGYYCSNNSKEDYNLEKPGQVWDDSSKKAHWRNRKPDQPFFAVFNSLKSHESQIRIRPHTWKHDPARAPVPSYHPDTPEVRQDWAQYYDQVSEADADAGERLKELEADGLAGDTIVFYYADHGSGMPRSKRWPYNSGLQVPLVVYVPEKWRALAPPEYRPGGKSDRLVSFVDLAPTVLSLAGLQPPAWMQGHAFMGRFTEPPQPYLYGFRGRMDERYDLVRSVTDGRYVYVRNYMPHKIYGQHLAYMWETPTTRVWEELHRQGKLNEVQDAFWKTKPSEELYDLRSDPDEVHNLAASREQRQVRDRLQAAQQALARKIRDVGFLPEGELFTRSPGRAPYDVGQDPAAYPFERVFDTAERASVRKPADLGKLRKALGDRDSAVRHWAALGLLMQGRDGVRKGAIELRKALRDSSPYVRADAAEALAEYGEVTDRQPALDVLAEQISGGNGTPADLPTVWALTAIDELGERAAPLRTKLQRAAETAPDGKGGDGPAGRYAPYVPALLKWLTR